LSHCTKKRPSAALKKSKQQLLVSFTPHSIPVSSYSEGPFYVPALAINPSIDLSIYRSISSLAMADPEQKILVSSKAFPRCVREMKLILRKVGISFGSGSASAAFLLSGKVFFLDLQLPYED